MHGWDLESCFTMDGSFCNIAWKVGWGHVQGYIEAWRNACLHLNRRWTSTGENRDQQDRPSTDSHLLLSGGTGHSLCHPLRCIQPQVQELQVCPLKILAWGYIIIGYLVKSKWLDFLPPNYMPCCLSCGGLAHFETFDLKPCLLIMLLILHQFTNYPPLEVTIPWPYSTVSGPVGGIQLDWWAAWRQCR